MKVPKPFLSTIISLQFLLLLFISFTISCSDNINLDSDKAKYVGYLNCANCHQNETTLWKESDHFMAMKIANKNTVLGDFNNASIENYGVTSKFFERENKYFTYTEGPDGEMGEFEIKYTFGVRPLQQYLIEFPNGKLQTLPFCWDSRPKDEGGQKWFHIYPDERVTPDDELYWTHINQNWNYMCADCHSTNLKRNYDVTTRNYNTTWSEINVSCEACHGPGSVHVQWAEEFERGNRSEVERDKGFAITLKDPNRNSWVLDKDSVIARRILPKENDVLIEACAPCHSRRTSLVKNYEFGKPLLDTHNPGVLREIFWAPNY